MWTIVGTIVVVIATIVLGVLADRKWKLLPSPEGLREAAKPKQLPAHGPGEAPATALPLAPEERTRLAAKQRCPRCRATMALAGDESVTYEGRELRVLAFRCTRCDGTRSLYIAPRGVS
ncbi:MAG TPA: hypothetical protein VM513_12280 [Kofleriaceae bacterium]|jgi:hypothetical protein|nr:hypothetical protein [Kofleriaceae bacterium]